MKNKKEDLINKFKLPKYIKGKSFADASKAIQAKFEGLNDKAAKDTKEALMQRLADMQEYIKAEQAPPEQYQQMPQQIDPSQMQMAMGGNTHVMPDGTRMPGKTHDMAMGGAVDPMSMLMQKGVEGANMGIDGGVNAFGKTGISTSGNQNYQKEKVDIAGGMKDWISNPMGGIKMLGDVIGTGKANKDISQANQNFDIGSVNKPLNAFAFGGGMMGPGDKVKTENSGTENVTDKSLNTLNEKTGIGFDRETANRLFYKNSENKMSDLNMGKYKDANYFNVNKQTDSNMYNINPTSSNPQNAQGYADQMNEIKKLNPNAQFADNGYQDFQNRKAMGGYQNQLADGLDGRKAPLVGPGAAFGVLDRLEGGLNSLQSLNNNIDSKVGTDNIPQSFVDKAKESSNKANTSNDKEGDKKNKNSNYLENALRYVPTAMNAFQLLDMEKPEVETRQKLDGKYNPQMVDETRIQKDILANQSNTSRALQNISGGSKGFVAANMAGADINASKAIGNAAVQAQSQNNAQLQYGQQFDRQADQFNIGQNNLEQDLTDRNKGVYDTNKSALLGQLGTDIGNIGKEELFKKYPEMMGMSYDSNGNYILTLKDGSKKTVNKDTGEEVEEQNQQAMGGYQSAFNGHMNMLMNPKKK
tara:strand:+ start:9310 stop:11235 length:1926 start_codon:yes stop_codon:yes gene_type:complete